MSDKESKGKSLSKFKKSLSSKTIDLKAKWTSPTAKQAIAEKLNSDKRRTVVDLDVTLKQKIVDDWDSELPRISKALKKQIEAIQGSAGGKEAADAFSGFSTKVYSPTNDPNWVPLTMTLAKVAHLHEVTSKADTYLSNVLTTEVMNPLQDFVKKDIHKLKEEKRAWNQARLGQDAAISKLHSLQEKNSKDNKIKEADAECNAMKASFEKADRSLKKEMQGTLLKGETEQMKAVLQYVKAYKAYFEMGSSMMKKMEQDIQEMEDSLAVSKQALETFYATPIVASPSKNSSSSFYTDEEHATESEGESRNSSLMTSDDEDKDNTEGGDVGDVGDVLSKLMQDDDKKREKAIEIKQREAERRRQLEENRKSRPPFDYAKELQFGSFFHQFFTDKLKEQLIPNLIQQLNDSKLDPVEEELDTGKLGQVAYGLSGMAMKDVDIPLDEVYVSFTESGMNITWSKISASIQQLSWHYEKNTFPKLKDKGFADASMVKTIISVNVGIEKDDLGPKLKLQSVSTKVGSLDVKISKAAISVAYNILLTAFSNTLKTKVQAQLETQIHDLFECNLDEITSDFIEFLE